MPTALYSYLQPQKGTSMNEETATIPNSPVSGAPQMSQASAPKKPRKLRSVSAKSPSFCNPAEFNTRSLLDLPLEIRLEIYDWLIADTWDRHITLGVVKDVQADAPSAPAFRPHVSNGLDTRHVKLSLGRTLTKSSTQKTTFLRASDSNRSPRRGWSPFNLLQTCTQVQIEFMEQVVFRIKQGAIKLNKVWVVYPFAARYLDGVYKPLLEVAKEIQFVGYHHLQVSDLKGLRRDSGLGVVPSPRCAVYAHIQAQAMSALRTCIHAFETSSQPKIISMRIFFPSHDARDIYAATFSADPSSASLAPSTPIALLLGASVPHLSTDISIWRGDDGDAAWAMKVTSKPPPARDETARWDPEQCTPKPKGRDMILTTRWQQIWKSECWMPVILDTEGGVRLWKPSCVNQHFGDPREFGVTLTIPSAMSR